jgi:aminoglycoside 6-adenylyltransferase
MDHQRVLDDVRRWTSTNENIRLVVLTGSVAREDGAADELSDLDIELYVLDAAPLLDRRDWYHEFGQVLVVEELDNPDWHPTRLIYYLDGKIDFMVAQVEAAKRGIGYTRPYRVLVDKDGLSDHLHLTSDPKARPPTAAEFATCINWFYAAVLMCAKCIVRNEPWMAKLRDWDLKTELLRMIVWDHTSRYGWDFDTWDNGAHMRKWMDTKIVAALGACWAGFSAQEMAPALSSSVALFDTLSRRTAIALGIEPFDSGSVVKEIDRVLGLAGRTSEQPDPPSE